MADNNFQARNNVQDDEDGGAISEAPAALISVALARKLLRYSKNATDLPVTLNLDFSQCSSKEALEFVGEALRCNTLIENLTIELCDEEEQSMSAETLQDLCYFISHNPSLRLLMIGGGSDLANSKEISQTLLEAAKQNNSIERIQIGSPSDATMDSMPENYDCLSSCRELELRGLTEQLAQSTWPENHSIETLRLFCQESQSKKEFESNLSTILEKLEQSPSARRIRHLDLSGWSKMMSTFLSSPNSAVQRLKLTEVSFQHSDIGCSPMDGLLWGLVGRGDAATTSLDIHDCGFDALSIKKLLNALKHNHLAINHLRIHGLDAFRGQDLRDLLTLPCLESLGLLCWGTDTDDVDKHIGSVDEGLQECSLSSVTISTGMLARLERGLTTALSQLSLTRLDLFRCDLFEADIDCLVRLIKDKNCHLQHLSLTSVSCMTEEGSLESKVFECLHYDVCLASLQWMYYVDETPYALFEAAGNTNIEKWTLKTFKIFTPDASAPGFHDAIDSIASSMSANWELEELAIAGVAYDFDDPYPEPIATVGQLEQISAYENRNRMKKLIFSPALHNMTKAECVGILASLWEGRGLPDWLSLALWLIEEVPHHFFE
ncbi:expressed unknown protein [Seminavis robusta]|uniref:Uncharacterized protein n=1 Tax=Seminavis robusta TaxID=568900 RepID=A0A9N8DZK1_9STRA|nr:expressed unknown protein [Seminavis robusta]|eukprot:Sro503_g155790.1 n/a (606) ;mRNA; r:22889-24706